MKQKQNTNNAYNLLFMENLSLLIRHHEITRSNQQKIGYFSRYVWAKYRNIATFWNVLQSPERNLRNAAHWLRSVGVNHCESQRTVEYKETL